MEWCGIGSKVKLPLKSLGIGSEPSLLKISSTLEPNRIQSLDKFKGLATASMKEESVCPLLTTEGSMITKRIRRKMKRFESEDFGARSVHGGEVKRIEKVETVKCSRNSKNRWVD